MLVILELIKSVVKNAGNKALVRFIFRRWLKK